MLKLAISSALNRLFFLVAIAVALKLYGPSNFQLGEASPFDQLGRAIPGLTNLVRAFE